MQLYEVTDGFMKPAYRRKQADAHAEAKLSPTTRRADVRIRLFDYPSDIEAFEGLFNGERPAGTLKRTWALTNRGGLREVELTSAGEEVAPAREEEPAEEPQQPTESAGAFWARVSANQKAAA